MLSKKPLVSGHWCVGVSTGGGESLATPLLSQPSCQPQAATDIHHHGPASTPGKWAVSSFFFVFLILFLSHFYGQLTGVESNVKYFPQCCIHYVLFIGQLTLSEYGQYLNVIIYHFYISWRDRLRARMSSIKCPVGGDSYLSCQSQRTLQDRLPPGPRTPHGALSATRCDGLDLSTVLQMCQDITTWDPTRHWLSEAVRGIFLKILQSHQHFYSFRGI